MYGQETRSLKSCVERSDGIILSSVSDTSYYKSPVTLSDRASDLCAGHKFDPYWENSVKNMFPSYFYRLSSLIPCTNYTPCSV